MLMIRRPLYQPNSTPLFSVPAATRPTLLSLRTSRKWKPPSIQVGRLATPAINPTAPLSAPEAANDHDASSTSGPVARRRRRLGLRAGRYPGNCTQLQHER